MLGELTPLQTRCYRRRHGCQTNDESHPDLIRR